MSWPSMSDYQDTIQNPNTCFSDPELKNGTPLLNNLGLPKPIAGGFACVYEMICDTRNYAVRCFLTEQLELEKRYKIISDYLRKTKLSYMVNFEFIAQGIRVKGQWFPILKMEWINGEPLNSYLEANLNNPLKLKALAVNFINLIGDLRKYSIAHGDLQHENILVSNEELKLIDYDGLYVPGLETIPSGEYGHRNYQHPSRSEKDFGPELDNFSAWVIYTSILALSEDPNLWDLFKAGDGALIFRKEDFLDPDRSSAFKLFEQSSLVSLNSIAGQLRILLNFNDPSKIPIPDANAFSSYLNPLNNSPQGLPSWLQDYVKIKTETTGFNILKKRFTTKALLIGKWLLGIISICLSYGIVIFFDLPIIFCIVIGLSLSVSLIFMKQYKNQEHDLNNELQKHYLEDSNIPGIGPQLISSLNHAGITTAADILNIHIVRNNQNRTKEVALIEVAGKGKIRIEGIGPVKARALLEWKNLLRSQVKKLMLRHSLQLNVLKARYEQRRSLVLKKLAKWRK